MAVFIVLWPYLLTTKLKSVIRHNLGHSNEQVTNANSERNWSHCVSLRKIAVLLLGGSVAIFCLFLRFAKNTSCHEWKAGFFCNNWLEGGQYERWEIKGQLISKCPFGVIVWTKIAESFYDVKYWNVNYHVKCSSDRSQ